MSRGKTLSALALSALLCAPRVAHADFNPNPGLQLGFRTGFIVPFGGTGDAGVAPVLNFDSYGFIPFEVEAGWRVTTHMLVGATFQYAHGLTRNCDFGSSCGSNRLSVGVEGHYHFVPQGNADPWVGIGTGYEWLNVSSTENNDSEGNLHADATFRGFQFLNLQAGVDFAVSRNVKMAPFVEVAIGRYSSWSADQNGGDFQSTALHELLTFGVRVSVDL